MTAAHPVETTDELILDDLQGLLHEASTACVTLLERANRRVAEGVREGDKLSAAALEREQHTVHGLAWLATYAQSLTQMASWAARMEAEGRFGELEALLAQVASGALAAQIAGGIPMRPG